MSNANPGKLLQDAATILESAISAAPGASFVSIAIADAQAIKDAIAQGILAIGPVDATSLDPGDRADIDAEIDAQEAKS